MEKGEKAHCLVFFCPIQGHINPMLQFSKRLEHKGLKVTFITTRSVHKAMHEGGGEQSTTSFSSVAFETIPDGFDGEGGSAQAESIQAYRDRSREIGSQTLAELIDKLSASGHPVDCIVYDPVFPWALDVAKRVGIAAAAFFTILLPGLPPLQPSDTPSFIYVPESYPALLKLSVDLFSNLDKADWVSCNTFYELEQEVIEYWMTKFWPLRTIGPTIPSMYLDKRHEDNKEYGLSLLKLNSDACMKWLNAKPKGSIAYMSFGSMAEHGEEQMEELGLGLRRSKRYFLWVVRASESVKLPKGFVEETSEKAQADVEGIVRGEEIAHCVREILDGERGKEIRKNASKWKALAKNAVDEGGSSDKNIDEFIAELVQR
ncbi:hypothetical protein ACE6H2_027962 [Prunus campanulata]